MKWVLYLGMSTWLGGLSLAILFLYFILSTPYPKPAPLHQWLGFFIGVDFFFIGILFLSIYYHREVREDWLDESKEK